VYLLIAGGGKVGSNLARALIRDGHEVTLIEQRPVRFDQLEAEFEHQVHRGDATELFVLERAGIKRPPDVVVAVTGDDEDNIVICQLARDCYGVETTIARVNDPRNQPYFDLLGITPTVSATASIMGLIEHEVPEHGLIRLLELRKENREIVEITIGERAKCAGKAIREIELPQGTRVISVFRNGKAEEPDGAMQLETGDSVVAILEPGKEDELRRILVRQD
jgi:trk system potassium uptake protein TrkA